MNFFKDLRDSGVYADDDPLHKECLKVLFHACFTKRAPFCCAVVEYQGPTR